MINICLVYYIFNILIILLSIALFTLLEQKVLRSIQIRLGPDIRGYWGILQPIADAVKLLTKETIFLPFLGFIFYFFSTLIRLIFRLLI